MGGRSAAAGRETQVPSCSRSALQVFEPAGPKSTGLQKFGLQVRLPAWPKHCCSSVQSVRAEQVRSQKVVEAVQEASRSGSATQASPQAQSALVLQGSYSSAARPIAHPASEMGRQAPSSIPSASWVTGTQASPDPQPPASARGSQSARHPKPPSASGKQSVPAPHSAVDPRCAEGSQLPCAGPSARHTRTGSVGLFRCWTNGEKYTQVPVPVCASQASPSRPPSAQLVALKPQMPAWQAVSAHEQSAPCVHGVSQNSSPSAPSAALDSAGSPAQASGQRHWPVEQSANRPPTALGSNGPSAGR